MGQFSDIERMVYHNGLHGVHEIHFRVHETSLGVQIFLLKHELFFI